MSVAVTQVAFDEALAKTYQPIRVVKQAVLVPVPDGIETTIFAEWGEEQKFVGAWYAIYSNEGKVKYGSGKTEFDETHGIADETENGYFKNTPIEAYQYHGPDARVVTVAVGLAHHLTSRYPLFLTNETTRYRDVRPSRAVHRGPLWRPTIHSMYRPTCPAACTISTPAPT